MSAHSIDAAIQARAAVLAYRLLLCGVLVMAVISGALASGGMTVGAYRLVPLDAWRGVPLMTGGLVLAVLAAEMFRSAMTALLARHLA